MFICCGNVRLPKIQMPKSATPKVRNKAFNIDKNIRKDTEVLGFKILVSLLVNFIEFSDFRFLLFFWIF